MTLDELVASDPEPDVEIVYDDTEFVTDVTDVPPEMILGGALDLMEDCNLFLDMLVELKGRWKLPKSYQQKAEDLADQLYEFLNEAGEFNEAEETK